MATEQKQSKVLHIILWVVQVVLALAFGMAGFMKLTAPIPDLAAQMVWPGDIPAALVRFIGASELAAALGLILPALTRIKPILTAYAGWGLVIVMLLAALFHSSRGEYSGIAFNLVFMALAFFVGWGRSKKAPITAK
ncbi:DoxX family protein [uncultured Imperialibacter sp.]|uniref:DoxX family protein n=1 Tax=uncultured Imperialibacter sp. TaxID=1672639 RepID=UPI0030DB4535|tara:strand:+ start:44578 stop:44988 length:411 start_codon:yes stop_codon:yes gene_type:complete